MAVGFGSKMTGGNGVGGFVQDVTGATSISSTGITVPAGATDLWVPCCWASGFAAGPTTRVGTWGGVSLTEEVTSIQVLGGSNSIRASIFKLSNPASGTGPLAFTWGNACDLYMGAEATTGSNSNNSADNTIGTNVTTINVPTDASGMTIACFIVDGAAPTMNFVLLFSEDPFSPGGGANYQLGGTGTNAHTATGGGGTGQVFVGLHIVAAGAVVTPVVNNPVGRRIVGYYES